MAVSVASKANTSNKNLQDHGQSRTNNATVQDGLDCKQTAALPQFKIRVKADCMYEFSFTNVAVSIPICKHMASARMAIT